MLDDPKDQEMFAEFHKRHLENLERRRVEPWNPGREPVREWNHAGFRCMTIYGLGSLNGYVIVPKNHLWHKIHYLECPIECGEVCCVHRPEEAIEVHGGLTFSGLWKDGGWVFGFDTAHYNDMTIFSSGFVLPGIVRDDEYVEKETEKMAEQLKEFML